MTNKLNLIINPEFVKLLKLEIANVTHLEQQLSEKQFEDAFDFFNATIDLVNESSHLFTDDCYVDSTGGLVRYGDFVYRTPLTYDQEKNQEYKDQLTETIKGFGPALKSYLEQKLSIVDFLKDELDNFHFINGSFTPFSTLIVFKKTTGQWLLGKVMRGRQIQRGTNLYTADLYLPVSTGKHERIDCIEPLMYKDVDPMLFFEVPHPNACVMLDNMGLPATLFTVEETNE